MREVSAIVVSFNRRDALLRTIRELLEHELIGEIIVVDNASTDSSAAAARELLSTAARGTVVDAGRNSGVEAFNTGAALARGPLLLILDDDAWPEPESLRAACRALDEDSSLGAVALSPVHPARKQAEWPHASAEPRAFPMMGCGNLVRADAWRAVGGYFASYFLYRNDADLALSLLARGIGVRFDPAWVVWHDSPHAARKSERWLNTATRNWVWMARRHGRGVWKWLGLVLGCARALAHAGVSPRRVWLVLRGVFEGFATSPARPGGKPDGSHWKRLIRVQLRRSIRG